MEFLWYIFIDWYGKKHTGIATVTTQTHSEIPEKKSKSNPDWCLGTWQAKTTWMWPFGERHVNRVLGASAPLYTTISGVVIRSNLIACNNACNIALLCMQYCTIAMVYAILHYWNGACNISLFQWCMQYCNVIWYAIVYAILCRVYVFDWNSNNYLFIIFPSFSSGRSLGRKQHNWERWKKDLKTHPLSCSLFRP